MYNMNPVVRCCLFPGWAGASEAVNYAAGGRDVRISIQRREKIGRYDSVGLEEGEQDLGTHENYCLTDNRRAVAHFVDKRLGLFSLCTFTQGNRHLPVEASEQIALTSSFWSSHGLQQRSHNHHEGPYLTDLGPPFFPLH